MSSTNSTQAERTLRPEDFRVVQDVTERVQKTLDTIEAGEDVSVTDLAHLVSYAGNPTYLLREAGRPMEAPYEVSAEFAAWKVEQELALREDRDFDVPRPGPQDGLTTRQRVQAIRSRALRG